MASDKLVRRVFCINVGGKFLSRNHIFPTLIVARVCILSTHAKILKYIKKFPQSR
jgi:hypothetical protein